MSTAKSRWRTRWQDALALAKLARERGVRHGVVQDKLFLPGIRKLKRLIDSGFFGRILSVRGEFGYWVFEGDWQPAQRPSWNYRSEDGGGIVMDMLSHWRYVLDHTFGPVKRVSCLCATHIPRRWDENGQALRCTAEDAAYACFEIEGGIVAQMNSSWACGCIATSCSQIQVDGTHGSAVAGLRECRTQHRANTPKPVWNPDIPNAVDFFAGWQEVPDNQDFRQRVQSAVGDVSAARRDWARRSSTICWKAPKACSSRELALASWREGRWMDVPELEA